jgi:murein DD-endopeptidase MepM/ murein hydrolase activator NlpD
MAKDKYIYNPRTLSYEKVELSFAQKLKRVGILLIPGFIFTISSLFLIYTFVDSPKEAAMRQENQQLLTQYELLNREMDDIQRAMTDIIHRDDNIYRVILEADPVPGPIRQAGVGGTNRYKNLAGFASSPVVIETRKRLDKIEKQLSVQSKSFDDVVALAATKEIMLASIPAIQPINNKDLTRMASGFGMRMHPIHKIQKFHQGMDFTAVTGTEIYSTGDGKVTFADYKANGYGIHVIVDHGFGYETLYAHMDEVKVRSGQAVKRGDVIGLVGNTGLSAGPHLHYEVHKEGKAVNPANFYFNDLTPEEYEKMLILSRNPTQSLD